jgi:alpha-1,2-mannosyltransferase
MSSRRLVAYLMFAIAAGMLCNGGAITALMTADTYDFASYYYAGRAVLDGQNPYGDSPVTAQAEEDGVSRTPFIYSPLVATLFTPVALLPFGVAARLAALLQLAALVAVAYLLAPYLLRDLDGDDRLLWAGFGALLLGAYHPAGYVLRVGQITFVIAALILLSLKLANEKRDLASGAVLGVGLVLKPVCAPLLLYYLLKRKWTVAAGAGQARGWRWARTCTWSI